MAYFIFRVKEDSNDSDSEHEEEFYYTEIEVNVDNVTQGLSDMFTASPSSPVEKLYITDHDYQKKVSSQILTSKSISTKNIPYST